MDAMDVVTYIRRNEDKLEHLHKAIDELSLNPEHVESVTVLQEIATEYKLKIDEARDRIEEASDRIQEVEE